MASLLLLGTLSLAAARVVSLPGVRTPQMGYNSWYDVLMSPSAEGVLETANALRTSGLQAAGYTYVNLDDGIVEATRGSDGNLVPTAAMGNWKALSDQLHGLGFAFGVYTDRCVLPGHHTALPPRGADDAPLFPQLPSYAPS